MSTSSTASAQRPDSGGTAVQPIDGVIPWNEVALDRRIEGGTMGSLFRATLRGNSEPLVLPQVGLGL